MAGDERSHQVKAEAMQGYNCFLYFHFPPIIRDYEQSQPASGQTAAAYRDCVCLSAPVCSLSSNILIDRKQGSH